MTTTTIQLDAAPYYGLSLAATIYPDIPSVTATDTSPTVTCVSGTNTIYTIATTAITTAGIYRIAVTNDGSPFGEWWAYVSAAGVTAVAVGDRFSASQQAGTSDPWATAVPGSYASGTAGNVLGNLASATAKALTANVASQLQAAWAASGYNTTTLYQGDDRKISDGTAITLTIVPTGGATAFPDLSASGMTYELQVWNVGNTTVKSTGNAEIVSHVGTLAAATSLTFAGEQSDSETILLRPGQGRAIFRAKWPSGDITSYPTIAPDNPQLSGFPIQILEAPAA